MKGQYRVVLEIFLVFVGILITSYVIANFESLQKNLNTVSVADNFNTIANSVIIGLVKSSTSQSSIIRISIPEKVSNNIYTINIDGENNKITVASVDNPKLSITGEIFNIGQTNRIISTQIISSSRILEIINEDGQIKIRRGI